jgi:hypothetical protein
MLAKSEYQKQRQATGNRAGLKGSVKGYGRTLEENFHPANKGEFHARGCHHPTGR